MTSDDKLDLAVGIFKLLLLILSATFMGLALGWQIGWGLGCLMVASAARLV